MAKGLRCAWAVFFIFIFVLFDSILFPSWLFSRFQWKVGLFFLFFLFFRRMSTFDIFILFLTHEAAFHYRSSGSFFHCFFSIYPLVIQLFQSHVCLFFSLFLLFPNQEAFPATKLYKDWLVLLLFSLSRFISIFGVDGRVFPFSLS